MPWRALLVAIVLTALAFAALRPSTEPVVRDSLWVFGSLAELELHHPDAAVANAAIAEVSLRWSGFHRDWHPWEDGALTQLNTALREGRRSQLLPQALLDLVALGQRFELESGGLLNPATGQLISLWGFHTSEFPVRTAAPSMATVAQIIERQPSMQDVMLEGGHAASANPAVQLDFSALAEGLALSEARAILGAHGVAHALVTLGGDVIALGEQGRRPWRVAIRHPDGGVLAEVDLFDGEALFSSGGYQRYREDGDGRWPHLIDPRSGRPSAGALASAVLHRDPVRADAASTALAIGGVEAFDRLVRDMQAHCALLVDREGMLHATPAMIGRLRLPADSAPPYPRGAAGSCDG